MIKVRKYFCKCEKIDRSIQKQVGKINGFMQIKHILNTSIHFLITQGNILLRLRTTQNTQKQSNTPKPVNESSQIHFQFIKQCNKF